MKHLLTYWTLFGVLVTTSIAQAQTPLYFFYDPACMQQLVYERVGQLDEQAHTDYYAKVSNDAQVILRVQNNPKYVNRKMMTELPVKPVLCGDPNYLSDNLMKEINANRRVAYVVVQMGQQYAVYNVHSVAKWTSNQKGIVYKEPMYGFNYQYKLSRNGDILNKGANKQRNIFYEKPFKTACLPAHEFKVVSRHIETPIKHLQLVEGIGVIRLYSDQGALQLTKVNGIPLTEVIAQRCNTTPALTPDAGPTATPEPVLPDTVGMTAVEKRVWMMRQQNRVVTPNVVTSQPEVPPPGMARPDVAETNPQLQPQSQLQKLLPGGIYIVQEKESLYTISERFNISVERLVELNGLTTYELGLNQPLKVVDDGSVPHKERNPQIVVDPNTKTKTTVHLVEQGQTLYGISKLYGITLKDIYALNPSLLNDQIDINQPIVVGYQKLPN